MRGRDSRSMSRSDFDVGGFSRSRLEHRIWGIVGGATV